MSNAGRAVYKENWNFWMIRRVLSQLFRERAPKSIGWVVVKAKRLRLWESGLWCKVCLARVVGLSEISEGRV